MKPLPTAIVAATMLITACGGGGGTVGPTPVADFEITSANAEAASKVAYEAALGSSELADLGGSIGVTATAPGSFSKPFATAGIPGIVAEALQNIPFGPEVFPCAVSGSVTLSGDIANPLTLTAGDSFLVVSTACNDGLGEVVDGSVSFTVIAFSGDALAGVYTVSMDAVADDLQVTTAQDTVTSNGDAGVTLDTTALPFVTASVSGGSMTTDTNTSSETLSNYASTQTVDGNQAEPPYTLVASGALQSTQLSGSVSYATPVTFEGMGDNFPHTGEMTISGENSSARLIAIDDVNVRIEVDSNGDGTVDETIDTTWANLTS